MHRCPHCPRDFKNPVDLHAHEVACQPFVTLHYVNRETIVYRNSTGHFVCHCDVDTCGKKYTASSDIAAHVSSHRPNWVGPPKTVTVPSSSHPSLPYDEGALATFQQSGTIPEVNQSHPVDPSTGTSICVAAPLQVHPYLARVGLYHEPTLHILICPDCEVALTASSAVSHIRNNHPIFKSSLNESYLASTCTKLDIVAKFPVITAAVPPITGLPLVPGALQCAVSGCLKLYTIVKSMRRHYRESHPATPIPSSFPTGPAQKFDNCLNSQLFPVHPPPALQHTPNASWLMTVKSQISGAIKLDPLHVSDPRELNAWLRSTTWPSHVAPYDPQFLQSLVAPPTGDELPWLKQAVYLKFLADVKLIEKTPLLALQRLNTDDPLKTGISNTPFQAHQKGDQTLEKYTTEPLRLIAFLLRDRGHYKLPLLPSVESAIQTLKSLPNNASIQQYVDSIQDLLFLVWSSPWQPSAENSLADPTHCYLALSSIRHDFRWAHAKDITNPLAKLTYCIRLVVLRQAHASIDVTAAIGSLTYMFTEKVESTFNTIRSLQHQASSIAYATTSLPVSHWVDDTYSSVIFSGAKIAVSDVRNMGRQIILSTYHLMVEHVFLGKDLVINYDHIADDLTDQTPGYCFLDDSRNAFLGLHEDALLQAILGDPSLCKQFVKGFHPGSNMPLWNLPRLRRWYHDFCHLQLRFAALIQLLGGAPARGTELLCLQYRNTPSQMRGFYKMHNNWVILCQYSKTSALTGHDKFIPHGLDAFTGDMLFHALVFALPLAKVFATTLFPSDVGVQKLLHTHLFPNVQKLYGTEHLSDLMKSISVAHLATPLPLAQWRQLFVTIRRKHCPDLDALLDFETVNTVGALQAGHSRQTENRIYGLTPDSFTHHSEDVVQAFLNFTKKWAQFMNVPPGHLKLSYRLLSSPERYLLHLPEVHGTSLPPSQMHHYNIEALLAGIQARLDQIALHLPAGTLPLPLTEHPHARGTSDHTQSHHPPLVVPSANPSEVACSSSIPLGDTCPHPEPPQPLFSSWPPQPSEHDELLELEQRCLQILRRLLKDPAATWRSDHQRDAVLAAASRCNDVVSILPTGGGKTMVPLISALLNPLSVTIFILPFVSLVYDYERRLDRYGVKYTIFKSDTPRISGKEPILLVSTETAHTTHFAQCLQEAHLRIPIPAIVLDEVQTVPAAQHYRSSLRRIYALRSIPAQWILLSGTIPPISLSLILHSFHTHQEAVVLRAPTNRPELRYIIQPPVRTEVDLIAETVSLYYSLSADFTPQQRALVYVPYLDLGHQLALRLHCDFYAGHESITPQQRREMYENWVSGDNSVMVCTHAFGAGNDYDQVSLIIHAGTPYEMVNYVQEVGRAGRDGKAASCYLIPRTLRKEPIFPDGAVDHTGLRAMHHLIFASDLCIRFLITQFTDDEGVLCSQSPHNILCSRCMHSSSDSTSSRCSLSSSNALPSGSTGHPSDPNGPPHRPSIGGNSSLPMPSSVPRPPSNPTATEPNTPNSCVQSSSGHSLTRRNPFSRTKTTTSSLSDEIQVVSSNKAHSSSIHSASPWSLARSAPRSDPSTPLNTRKRLPQNIPNIFEAQAESSKRRRVDELTAQHEYRSRLKTALLVIGDDCTCCLVLGQDPDGHMANNCTDLPAGGFNALKMWRGTVNFNSRTHGPVCFFCHVPQIGDEIHPLGSTWKDCVHPDRIPYLLWTLFHHPDAHSALCDFFHLDNPSIQQYSRWLSATPVPGHLNNSMAVLLWFTEHVL